MSEAVAYGLIVASYRRRLGIVVVREFARHRYRQSQLVGLTREQLTAIARDAQRQRAGATRGEELAALVVELAQQGAYCSEPNPWLYTHGRVHVRRVHVPHLRTIFSDVRLLDCRVKLEQLAVFAL